MTPPSSFYLHVKLTVYVKIITEAVKQWENGNSKSYNKNVCSLRMMLWLDQLKLAGSESLAGLL